MDSRYNRANPNAARRIVNLRNLANGFLQPAPRSKENPSSVPAFLEVLHEGH